MEYLADSSSEALRWTCNMEEAERFPTHLRADQFAQQHGWHARVLTASENSIPEDRRPTDLSGGVESRHELNERPTPLPDGCSPALVNSGSRRSARPAQKLRQRRRRKTKTAARQHWVIETYG